MMITVAAVLVSVVAAAPPADAAPVNCRMGAYIVSLSRVDTAALTFDTDLCMWSLCPDAKTEPLKSMEFVS